MMRKSITLIILVLVFSLLGCVTTKNPKAVAVSDNESKRESVEELFNLINAESLIDTTYSQLGQYIQGMGQQLGVVKPSEQELFDEFMSKVVSLMTAEMTWDKIKEPMIKIYLKHYSEKEIQDQIAFYKSDSGQSIIRKQPAVATDLMVLRQEAIKNLMPKLKKMSEEFEAKLTASKSYNSAAQADLRNAATAQEAYYVDNVTYTDSLENLLGSNYGLIISEGVTLQIISGDKRGYTMVSFHKNGDKKYQIKGPGGIITSEEMSTVESKKDFDNKAVSLLRNATVAQEAYYVDNQTYTQSKDELFDKRYGLIPLEKGLHINIITAGKNHYEMETFHDNGTKTYSIKGPGGIITSKPKEN